jgi:hypothetical protein
MWLSNCGAAPIADRFGIYLPLFPCPLEKSPFGDRLYLIANNVLKIISV